MVLIFMTLNQYKKNYLQSYTNPENLSYKWLSQMITVLLIAHLFVVTKFLFGFSNDLNLQLLLNVIVSIIALLVSSYFVLKALYQPQLFRGIELKEEPISVFVKKENKELATELTPEIEAKIKTLKTFMTEEEPFLDADLTIQNLALQIGFPPKELSILINHHLGKHFFDFINEYRIQKAKSILENPENKEITVLEILYQVGFNSKSSFNTAFKKHCQITPIEYRKQALSKK
jgi:AraC-like DNA-binding protein